MLDLKDRSRCSSCVVSLPSVRLLNGVSLIPEECRMIISLLAKCRIDFFYTKVSNVVNTNVVSCTRNFDSFKK